jgi:hypothetical protein
MGTSPIALPAITIPPDGSVGLVTVEAQAPDQSFQNLSSLTATLDDYTDAYIAATGSGTQFAIVPKGGYPAQGTSRTVNVTLQAASVDGTALPAYVQPAVIQGPPAPPQATVLIDVTTVTKTTVPADPGSATIKLI